MTVVVVVLVIAMGAIVGSIIGIGSCSAPTALPLIGTIAMFAGSDDGCEGSAVAITGSPFIKAASMMGARSSTGCFACASPALVSRRKGGESWQKERELAFAHIASAMLCARFAK